ncbi:MAG: hypothetical protein ABWY00_16520 [Dongiaceae bacterium]
MAVHFAVARNVGRAYARPFRTVLMNMPRVLASKWRESLFLSRGMFLFRNRRRRRFDVNIPYIFGSDSEKLLLQILYLEIALFFCKPSSAADPLAVGRRRKNIFCK